MNIAFDMMGGDFAPLEAVKGLNLYLSAIPGPATIFCIGDETQVQPLLQQFNLNSASIKFIHAPETIGYHEPPTKALKEKTKSSIAIGFHLLATGKVDAFISAGNTGAMLVGTMYSIKATSLSRHRSGGSPAAPAAARGESSERTRRTR